MRVARIVTTIFPEPDDVTEAPPETAEQRSKGAVREQGSGATGQRKAAE